MPQDFVIRPVTPDDLPALRAGMPVGATLAVDRLAKLVITSSDRG